MQNLKSRLKRRLAPLARRYGVAGPFRCNLDGIRSGAVVGWVADAKTHAGNIQVGLFSSEGMLSSMTANVMRGDVADAKIGDGRCGFEFHISPQMREEIAKSDGNLTVRTLDRHSHTIGTVFFQTEVTVELHLDKKLVERCRAVLLGDLKKLVARLEEVGDCESPVPALSQPPLVPHAKMFDHKSLLHDAPESGQAAYLDYVRYRYRMDEVYDVAPELDASDHYLYWYLTAYRSQERRRVPLSAQDIEYLNAPVVMAGQTNNLSRMVWWRLMGRHDLLASLNLNDRDAFIRLVYWWAIEDAPALNFEDCLVPDRFADLLRGVHPSRRLDAYPLSYFIEHNFLRAPQFHFLDMGSGNGRQAFALCLLVLAMSRPDYLRFMPHRSIDALLRADSEGSSPFERFVNAMLGNKSDLKITRDHYISVLRLAGFDLQSQRFMSVTAEGDRFEAAAMPRPDAGEEVDVQLIGPLAKASGLGQAVRLSADVLRATGLKIRGVDFDLDNPAPEGFSTDTMIEEYGPAKINLIHLNAESIPLAFAYQPDVFSGRYNIGYFFWELDKPAYCHYLGMEMLDEIWVSTEYGVQIYQKDAGGKPVVNVGMSFEDNKEITREAGRDFVNRRFLFDDKHYVCLVAFDSFSFVQRKNPVSVLLAFQKAFEGVKNARLVVKTQNRDNVFDPVQVQLWARVEAIISSDSRIVVMNETLPYTDLLKLKAGSDCYISLHKSEGWGFGMIEAMNLKVPVVCTAYSGNMDFCSDETAWLVDYEEHELVKGEYIFVRPGSQWAEPLVESAAAQLRAAYDDPAARAAKAKAAHAYISKNFSTKAIAKRYGGRLKEILKELKNG